MSMKTFGTFAVIIGCFAVLYPKFLHPVMSRLFGLQSKSSNDIKDGSPQYYPPGRHPEERRPPHMSPSHAGDGRQHMRPGPHPGMRAAAEIHRQQSQHGSGRGMMGIVLPMYAVGIVLYLVYTLVKVFGKKDKSVSSGDRYHSQLSDYKSPLSHCIPLTPQEKTKELQTLLLKADEKSISNEEMKELQQRLEETEAQMSQILQAMQLVHNKMDTHIQGQTDNCEEQKRKFNDSSPEVLSYENVKEYGRSDQQKTDNNVICTDFESIRAEKREVEQFAQNVSMDAVEKVDTVEEEREAATSDGTSKVEVTEEQAAGSGVIVRPVGDGCVESADDQVEIIKCPVEEECSEEEKWQERKKVFNSDDTGNVRYRQVPKQSSH